MKNFSLNCNYTKPDGMKTSTNVEFTSSDIHKIIGYFEDFLVASGYILSKGEIQLTNIKPYKDVNGN